MTYIGEKERTVRKPKPNKVSAPIKIPNWPVRKKEEAPVEVPNWPLPVVIPVAPSK